MTGLHWLPFNGLAFTSRIDAAAKGAMEVTGIVAFAVLLYAVGYEKREAHRVRFFALYGFFVAAMLVFLAADSLLLIYVAWEAMSLASAALVGIRTASITDGVGAMRTLITTRLGDLALLLGIGMVYAATGSTGINALPSSRLSDAAIALVCVGVLAKSAALPFSAWLPGAMVAPTPVSALLHSATLVAAGPWLLARMSPAFTAHPAVQSAMLVILACTALWGAFLAVVSLDAKRVLAYSTIEQMAQASIAAAIGLPVVAFAILAAHAAAKPGLFFAAGDLQRATGSTSLLASSRAARREPGMLLTAVFGAISLAGIPPFYSSWSSARLWTALWNEHLAWGLLGGVLAFSAGLYLARFVLLLFPIENREFHREHIDFWMRYTGITCVLAGLALAVPSYRGSGVPMAYALPLCALAGYAAALLLRAAGTLKFVIPQGVPTIARADAMVRRPLLALSAAIRTIDDASDAGLVRVAGATAANVTARADDAVEGGVENAARNVIPLGRRAARAISGNVSQYLAYVAAVLAAGGIAVAATRLAQWIFTK